MTVTLDASRRTVLPDASLSEVSSTKVAAAGARTRLNSIDTLRGLVMIVMALDHSRFLVTRGIWLVLIEFTVVRLGWSFDLHFNYFVAQVIFAISVSMVALSAIVHLPRGAIAAIGLAMIAGHNALDGIKAGHLGAAAPLWNLLHQPGLFDIAPGVKFFVLYPLISWIGVMAAGYALGPVFTQERAMRVQRCQKLRRLIPAAAARHDGFG